MSHGHWAAHQQRSEAAANQKLAQDTAKRRQYVQELFAKLDTNGDGRISAEELRAYIKSTGGSAERGGEEAGDGKESANQINELLQAADSDKDGDGLLDFGELLQFVTDSDKKLRLAFDSLDADADGHISPEEMQRALKEMGVKVSE